LFKLELIGPRSGAKEAYGIVTQQIQVGHVMIPLWSPVLRPDHHSSLLIQEEIAIHISTMLAVRPIREQPPQHSTDIPNDREQAETGRIIGSAVGVHVTGTITVASLSIQSWRAAPKEISNVQCG
jgi:hypothetical protein